MRNRQTADRAGLRFILAVLLAAMAGCGSFDTSIERIRANPEQYLNKEVTVSGTVTDLVKLPLVPAIYRLKDRTGEIFVLSDNPPPQTGATIRISGRVEAAATVGLRTFGLHIREASRGR